MLSISVSGSGSTECNRRFHDFFLLIFFSNFIFRRLAEDFLTDYMHINIGSQEMHANHNILQIVDVCEEYQKEQKLARLLEEIGCESKNKILIFVETKRKCDDLTRLMRRDGFPAMVSKGFIFYGVTLTYADSAHV